MAGFGIDILNRATESAFKNLHRQMRWPTSKDVIFYDNLSKDDIESIRAKYGDEGLLRYVEHMEKKRMKERG